MLTPQQIQDKKFEKALFNGYDMGQIDEFLDELLNDYTSLYKENATLKTKMKVLVDKIEEYRAVDEEMRKTLYTAQRTAREITESAQNEADSLLRNARAAAESSMADLQKQIEQEHHLLEEAKRVNAEYIDRIRRMMLSNADALLTLIDKPKDKKLPHPPKKAADLAGDFVVNLPEDVMGENPSIPPPPPQSQTNPVNIEPPRSSIREVSDSVRGGSGNMETRFFEVEMGGAKAGVRTHADPEATKPFGTDILTQKPRFEEKGIRFGKDYDMDED